MYAAHAVDSQIGNPSADKSCGRWAVPADKQRIGRCCLWSCCICLLPFSLPKFPMLLLSNRRRTTSMASSHRRSTNTGGWSIDFGLPPPSTKIASKAWIKSVGRSSGEKNERIPLLLTSRCLYAVILEGRGRCKYKYPTRTIKEPKINATGRNSDFLLCFMIEVRNMGRCRWRRAIVIIALQKITKNSYKICLS